MTAKTTTTTAATRLRTGVAAVLAMAFVAAAAAPAGAAVGVSAADDYALAQLGEDYGSASFRHHFYRNVPNKGLSQMDHEVFLDAKDAAIDEAGLAPL